jgi:hypothetical protein
MARGTQIRMALRCFLTGFGIGEFTGRLAGELQAALGNHAALNLVGAQ